MKALVILTASLLAQVAAAQTGRVTGSVRDSLTRVTLGGARVQLVPHEDTTRAPRTVVADSIGRFAFEGVEAGRYLIGFFHPLLDSLTLQPTVRLIEIGAGEARRIELATPPASRLRAAFCGLGPGGKQVAALVGIIRDGSSGEPVGGVSVVGTWMELSVGRGSITRRPARIAGVSAANGWFALCDVPSPGIVALSATRGADSTDQVEVRIPAERFARRELYVGSGSGRLTGHVMTTRGAPIGGAIIRFSTAQQARSDAFGDWSLAGLPLGTRMLEFRGICYYPVRIPVDITPTAPPVMATLSTLESVLDTVRIRAEGRSALWTGFEDRRRSSANGRFITEADVRKRAPTRSSDLLKYVPGIRIEGDDIKMRGAFSNIGEMGDCTPSLYLNGMPVSMPFGMRLDDIDMWVRPSEIKGIEVYPDAPPPMFQAAMSGCGSVVIWTKR